MSCNIGFFCCCKLAILENAKSEYVTKNLKNVWNIITGGSLPAHEPAAAAAAAAAASARQPTFTSEAEERRADWHCHTGDEK